MEDARWASPVQLAIAEDVSLGSSRKPSGFGPVCRELSLDEAIKERDPPIHALVGLGRLCVYFHNLGLGHGGLGDRGGLEACGGLDRWALFRCRGIVDLRLVEVSGEDVRGTRACADTIFASSSVASLHFHVMWLSSRPSNLSSRRCTNLQYASILGSW